jgi:hypothetical protein
MLFSRIAALEFLLSTDKPADMDDVYAVVGQAVSSLLKSGKTAEARSVNGQREVYARAVRVVTKLVN